MPLLTWGGTQAPLSLALTSPPSSLEPVPDAASSQELNETPDGRD